jgi:hypothetical protein
MPRRVDITALRTKTLQQIAQTEQRFAQSERIIPAPEYHFQRWVATMTAVEVHSIWERYAERRLVASLAHHPEHLVHENDIRGLARMPVGLANLLIRGGGRYFDFRSFDELLSKTIRIVGRTHNPFTPIATSVREYLDALAAIRNLVVHRSGAADVAYRRALRTTYGMTAIPSPEEFLNALDLRRAGGLGRRKRILGLIGQVRAAVQQSS